MPILFFKDSPEFRSALEHAISGNMTEIERLALVKRIRESDAIPKAKAISNRYLQKALKEIAALPTSPAKKSLREIALYMGKRKF